MAPAKGSARRRRAPRPERPRRGPGQVTRDEVNEILRLLRDRAEFMDAMRRDLDIQFKRIAQIQGELDRMRRKWEELP